MFAKHNIIEICLIDDRFIYNLIDDRSYAGA